MTGEQNGSKIEFLTKVANQKKICESNVVSILWKNTDLFFDYDLSLSDFSYDEWKTYFEIGRIIVVDEKKPVLDELTVGLSLEKHGELKLKYDKYKGYKTINDATSYVEVKNIDGYIEELKKWNAVIELDKKGFTVDKRFEEFKVMTSEEIYEEYEGLLNHIFANTESNDRVYDITDGIYELIDELDEGVAVGLPIYRMSILSEEIGGSLEGNVTLVGGLSGVGKSSFIRSTKIPSVLKSGEKLFIMINEEGLKKWQRELLVWVANNVFKDDLQKRMVRNGKYTKETKELLLKCAKWIDERKDIIKLIPFKKYSTSLAIKYIRKYSSLGVKYFVLDTFKADDETSNTEAFWFNMQKSMVRIYDVVKPEVKNVHIDVTFQLAKGSTRIRYYMQDNVGLAKNIIDVASTCLMIREVFDDEYTGEKKELKVYNKGGKNGKTQIPVTLEKGRNYQIVFIVKNREGGSGDFQIVIEHDLSRNTLKEIGITNVPQDF